MCKKNGPPEVSNPLSLKVSVVPFEEKLHTADRDSTAMIDPQISPKGFPNEQRTPPSKWKVTKMQRYNVCRSNISKMIADLQSP